MTSVTNDGHFRQKLLPNNGTTISYYLFFTPRLVSSNNDDYLFIVFFPLRRTKIKTKKFPSKWEICQLKKWRIIFSPRVVCIISIFHFIRYFENQSNTLMNRFDETFNKKKNCNEMSLADFFTLFFWPDFVSWMKVNSNCWAIWTRTFKVGLRIEYFGVESILPKNEEFNCPCNSIFLDR